MESKILATVKQSLVSSRYFAYLPFVIILFFNQIFISKWFLFFIGMIILMKMVKIEQCIA